MAYSFDEIVNAINSGRAVVKPLPYDSNEEGRVYADYGVYIDGKLVPNTNDRVVLPVNFKQVVNPDTNEYVPDYTQPQQIRLRERTGGNQFKDVNMNYDIATGRVAPPDSNQFYTSGSKDSGTGLGGFVSGLGSLASSASPVLMGLAGAYFGPAISEALGSSALGDLGATDASLGAAGVANAGAVTSPVTAGTVAANALPPVGTAVAPAVASTVAPAVAPTTTALSNLGATDASLGTAGAANAGTGGTNFLAGMGDVAATEGAGVSGTGILTNAPATSGSFLSNLIPSTPAGQIAAAQGLTGLGSALIGSNAAQKAADIQSAAAQNATALQGQMFNTINQQQAPYRSAGYNALNQLGSMGSGQYQQYDAQGNPTTTGTGTGYLTHQFNAADLAAGLAPNYDFMLQQGQMANQRAANVGGGAIGGNALQGLNKYTQDYALNAYQPAFNNYQAQRQNIYNTLAGIAGIGQAGQTATNTAAQNATNAQTQLGVGSAAAQAAGQVGTANAYGNALGQLGSGLTLASLLNQRGNATLPVA